MIYRWCIVGEPRCGSHWLHAKLTPKFGMDEFTNYNLYTNLNHDFYFDEDNYINRRPSDKPTVPLTVEKFIEKRIYQIKKIHPLQNVKAILFCNDYSYNYTEIIKTLEDRNFKFLLLERDLFDRALSHCVITTTNFVHRWNITYKPLPNPNALGPITINISEWINTLFIQYQSTEYRKKLFLNCEHITIRYDNLIEDCRTNNIPLRDADPILKTWDVKYEDVVTNIHELREIYDSFVNRIYMYSKFLLKYPKDDTQI
jgi:hypothetical protein